MIPPNEILRSQNFIAQSDFWFAITALETSPAITPACRKVVQRSDVLADYVNLFDRDKLTSSSVVFCKIDYLDALLKYVNEKPNVSPFILLTGQSDYPITDGMYSYVFGKNRLKWCGCNAETYQVTPIPLGIADDYCTLTVKSDFEKTKATKLLYVNHRVGTSPQVRAPLYSLFSDKSWATVRTPAAQGETKSYKEELLEHKFMLCPRGNGIDTHRMWEALYCGVTPIVQRHITHANLAGKLPILFVDSFEEVTEELLQQTYDYCKGREWDDEMLTVSWWMKHIKVGLR